MSDFHVLFLFLAALPICIGLFGRKFTFLGTDGSIPVGKARRTSLIAGVVLIAAVALGFALSRSALHL